MQADLRDRSTPGEPLSINAYRTLTPWPGGTTDAVMIRNLKMLVPALITVAALGALMTSTASALTPKIQVGPGDGNITGTKYFLNGGFSVSGGRTITCETESLSASLATQATTISATPKFENCYSVLAGVKVPATITTNGCTYVLHLGATFSTNHYEGSADIVCPAFKDIEIHVYKEGTTPPNHTTANQLCGYTIKGQSFLNNVTFENDPEAPIAVLVSFFLSGITYSRTVGTIPNCGAANGLALLSSTTRLTGRDTSGTAVNVTIFEV